MTRFTVFGAGMMGRVVADDLLSSDADATVALVDRSEALLAEAVESVDDSRLSTGLVDATDRGAAVGVGCS